MQNAELSRVEKQEHFALVVYLSSLYHYIETFPKSKPYVFAKKRRYCLRKRQKTPKGAFFQKYFVKTLVKNAKGGYSLTKDTPCTYYHKIKRNAYEHNKEVEQNP